MLEALKQKLSDEVERLTHELNVVLPNEIRKAVELGDLRENSEYKSALERQQFVQARLGQLRQRLGIQLQESQFIDKLTVEETLRLFRSFYDRGKTIDELLALVELESKRSSWVVKLSGGQKQRLSIACALVGDPDLLFLDEPSTGLDPQSRRQLWGVLQRYRAGGGTILLTTHYMDEAEVICDRVAIVDHGKIIALDSPKSLVAGLGAPKVIVHEGTLEDVFMSLTGRHLRDE